MNISEDKIIFTGPVGAGKTSAIASISDIPPVSTDVAATDETLERKEMTTVAMDYGFLQLEDGGCVHLYGTPGQKRFDFMWEILCRGGIGLVILIDASSNDPIDDVKSYLEAFKDFIQETGAVVGLTRVDVKENNLYERVQDILIERGYPIPVLEIDAREAEDVKVLVHALLAVL